MNKYITFILAIAAIVMLPNSGVSQNSCVTSECHLTYGKDKPLHPEDVSCGSCHGGGMEVHGQDGNKMPLSETMCAGCHDEQQGDYPHAHPPVATGNCYICHNPHGNIDRMLLPENFSLNLYVPYSEEEYKLCFLCHKRDLLMFPDTSFSTDFRDGLKNLHYLHVNKFKGGKNCTVCHAIHGGAQPKLIRESSLFGDWEMKFNFNKTVTGGSCNPGCHRMRSYDR